MEMEEKKNELTEAALPVQELPADIPDEVRQKLAKDLNESREYLALPDGPGRFTQDSSCPALLRIPLGFS